MRRLDELHLEHPFLGARKLARLLKDDGFAVGRRHVSTLMRRMGIEAIYRKPRTSLPDKAHRIYPYLLTGVSIERPNQVWATDITYLPMAKGFVYLAAILDLYSRKVLAWRTSNTLTSDFCVEALQEALMRFGSPEIFNTDQGSQFSAEAFTEVLKLNAICISMDGKGRWIDNVFVERLWRSVKYEEIVCYERNRRRSGRKRCFTKDEGRPLEVGLQEQASNRLKLRRLRACVVSVEGKGGARLRQVGIKKTNASEPLMTCRNVSKRRRNRDPDFCPAKKVGGSLLTAQSASGMKAA
jgi:transposase InsO family protein